MGSYKIKYDDLGSAFVNAWDEEVTFSQAVGTLNFDPMYFKWENGLCWGDSEDHVVKQKIWESKLLRVMCG